MWPSPMRIRGPASPAGRSSGRAARRARARPGASRACGVRRMSASSFREHVPVDVEPGNRPLERLELLRGGQPVALGRGEGRRRSRAHPCAAANSAAGSWEPSVEPSSTSRSTRSGSRVCAASDARKLRHVLALVQERDADGEGHAAEVARIGGLCRSAAHLRRCHARARRGRSLRLTAESIVAQTHRPLLGRRRRRVDGRHARDRRALRRPSPLDRGDASESEHERGGVRR